MIYKRKITLFFILLINSSFASADVWQAKNSWNNQWEDQYSDWIENEVDINLLEPIQLKVDCADICYIVRAIFARNQNLPYMASDVNGVKIGHYSDRWNQLPTANHWTQDKRFIEFLKFVVGFVSTKSFHHDTYPVAISPQTVKPGLVIYENIIANHACFIGRVNEDSIIPVEFFESTVPARVKFRRSTTLNIYIYEPDVPIHHSGIVRWNWPVMQNNQWVYVPDEQMPYYSTEIYHPNFEYRSQLSKPLNRTVKQHYYVDAISTHNALQDLVNLFADQVQFRNELIQEANEKLEVLGRHYRNDDFSYNYSTTSRDQRLNELIAQIWTALEEYDLPRQEFFEMLARVPVKITKDRPPVTLFHLFVTTHKNWLKSSAYALPYERWGLHWDNLNQQWLFNGMYPFSKVLTWYETANSRSDVFQNYIEDARN